MEYDRNLFNKFQQTILDKILESNLLTEEDFKLLCNPNFRVSQMTYLFSFFVSDMNSELAIPMTFEEKRIIANPEFSIKKMFELRCAARDECVNLDILKDMTHYDESKIKLYRKFIESRKFKIDEIKHYINMNFSRKQIDIICDGLENTHLYDFFPEDGLKLYLTEDFDDKQMEQIYRGFTYDDEEFYMKPLPIEKVKIYAKPEIDAGKMAIIKSALRTKTPLESIQKYLETDFDCEQSLKIADGIYHAYYYSQEDKKRQVDFEEIDFYADKRFDTRQMSVLRDAYWLMKHNFISMENMLKIKNLDYDFRRMEILNIGFKNDYDFDALKPLISYDLNDVQLLFIKRAISYKFNYEQIKILANPDNTLLELMTYFDGFKLGLPIEKIRNIMEVDSNINCYELMVRNFYNIDDVKYLSYNDYNKIMEQINKYYNNVSGNSSESIVGSEVPQNNKMITDLYMFINFSKDELINTPYYKYDYFDGYNREFADGRLLDGELDSVECLISEGKEFVKRLTK